MKQIFKFSVAIVFIAIFGVASCSTDEGTRDPEPQEVLMARSDRADSLAIVFLSIKASDEYEDFENSKSEMAYKLQYNKSAPLYTRSGFSSWMTTNLAYTHFSSVSEALDLWDQGVADATALRSAYSSFYNELDLCSIEEIQVILAPIMGNYPSKVNPNQCENSCMDWASDEIDANDAELAGALEGAWWPITIWAAHVYHESSFESIVYAFNICMAMC